MQFFFQRRTNQPLVTSLYLEMVVFFRDRPEKYQKYIKKTLTSKLHYFWIQIKIKGLDSVNIKYNVYTEGKKIYINETNRGKRFKEFLHFRKLLTRPRS